MQTSAREAALNSLVQCRRHAAWSGASIDNAIKQYSLDRRDAAFASALCLGVLQNSSLCDFYIGCYCSQPVEKLEPKLRDILRIGVYQLVFMDRVPHRAAVNETVALCKSSSLSRASGLVNAVLRRVAENSGSLPEVPGTGTASYLSVRYSHPIWLCNRIINERGYEFAEAFLASNNKTPSLDIQINQLKTDCESYVKMLDEQNIEYNIYDYPHGMLSIKGGIVSELPGYDAGLFFVQDRAARIASELCCVKPGMNVLDACAAPGGKSMSMAIAMENTGSIFSCDIQEKKLRIINENAHRLGIEIINARALDARKNVAEYEGVFDVVLADVPCSGLGVISKKPEIRQKTEEEISGLPEIQTAILDNLCSYVRPGGALIYSTCTVLKAENEDIISEFLKKHSDYHPDEIRLGDIEFKKGMHVFWPNTDGTDGFFAARLIRDN